jgi:zinc transport system substrate-binding protein
MQDGKGFPAGARASIITPLMRALTISLVLLAGLAGCKAPGRPATDSAQVTVVASVPPIASLVQALGGDLVSVQTLLPPGAHPDAFETTPRMAEALAGADLVVRVGGGLDDWIGDPGRAGHLTLSDHVALRGSHGHDHGGGTRDAGNPHIWLDPILVRDDILPVLVAALVDRAPDAEPELRRRADAFSDSLTALDAEIRDLLDRASVRSFIAAHPAWIYFAERYGLQEIGSLHPSPGRELGARELARLVNEARARGGAAVIAEPQLGRAGVDALARELAVTVEVADPVGGPGLEGREDYLSLMRFNAHAFARALDAAGAAGAAARAGASR